MFRHFDPDRTVLHLLWLLCIILLVAFVPRLVLATPAEPTAPGSIAGIVRDSLGTPLSQIRVALYFPDGQVGRVTTTGADGAYKIAILPAGDYRLEFSDPAGVYAHLFYLNAPNWWAATRVTVLGQDIVGIDAHLPLSGSITGHVTRAGEPVDEYYSVTLYMNVNEAWLGLASAGLDAAGVYQFTELPPGTYRVCAEGWGNGANGGFQRSCYDQISAGVEAASDVVVQAGQAVQAINIDFGSESDVAALSGKVTDPQGTPLADIAAYATRIDNSAVLWPVTMTQTNASGEYLFDHLAPSDYRIQFVDSARWYITEYYSDAVVAQDATTVSLAPTQMRTGIDAQLALGGRITGTVSILGQLIPSYALVEAIPSSDPYAPAIAASSIQSATGEYLLGQLPPGTYKVRAYAYFDPSYFFAGLYYGGDTFESATVLTVTAGAVVPAINFVFGEGIYDGVLTGQVTAAGAPAANIRVALYRQYECCWSSPQATLATDAAGFYRIEGLTTGNYSLLFSDPTSALAPYSAPDAKVQSGGAPTVVNASLEPAGRISGYVRRRDGSPASGSHVTAYRVGYWPLPPYAFYTTSDAAGNFLVPGLPSADYRVCAYDQWSQQLLWLLVFR